MHFVTDISFEKWFIAFPDKGNCYNFVTDPRLNQAYLFNVSAGDWRQGHNDIMSSQVLYIASMSLFA